MTDKKILPDIPQVPIHLTSARFDEFATSPVYIDKSLFIQRVLSLQENCLITRPRRSGKSLNLDMLRRFLELEVDEEGNPLNESSNSKYFLDNELRKLKINNVMSPDIQSHQGKYPVIFLSLVSVTGGKIGENEDDQVRDGIKKAIQNVFIEKSYLKPWLEQNSAEDEASLKLFSKIINGEIEEGWIIFSLGFLADLLERFHNNKVFLLVDEYDRCFSELMRDEALIQGDNERLCQEISQVGMLVSSLILACAQNRPSIKQIIVTGVLNTLISEANFRLRMCDLDDPTFNECFGFSEHEIREQILNTTVAEYVEPEQLTQIQQNLKAWYKGYTLPIRGMKSVEVYNPYSIMNYMNKLSSNKVIPHEIITTWISSGSNIVLTNLAHMKLEDWLFSKLLRLAQGQEVNLATDQYFRLVEHIKRNEGINTEIAISHILLHTGYITKAKDNPSYYKVPNAEVLKYFSEKVIEAYIAKKSVSLEVDRLNLKKLSNDLGPSLKNIQAFQKALVNLVAGLPKVGEKNEADFNTLVTGGIMFFSPFQEATHYVPAEASIGEIIDNIFYPYLERQKDEIKTVIIHEYKVLKQVTSERIGEASEEGLWQIVIKNDLNHPLEKFKHLQNSFEVIEARSITIYFDLHLDKWNVNIKSKRFTFKQATEIVGFFSSEELRPLWVSFKNKDAKKANYEKQKKKLLKKHGCQCLDELLENLTKDKQASIPKDIILEEQKGNNELRTNLTEKSVRLNSKKSKLTDQNELEKEILQKMVKIEIKKEDKMELEALPVGNRRSTRKRKAVSYFE